MQNYRQALTHLEQALDAAVAEGDALLAANISHPIDLVNRAILKRHVDRVAAPPRAG